LPCCGPGVPTQISESSVSRIASAVLVVARRRPFAVVSRISSSSPFSTIGLRPSLRLATLAGATSTPTTLCPSAANDAAETLPTYPRPNTETFITASVIATCRTSLCDRALRLLRAAARSLEGVLEIQRDARPVIAFDDELACASLERL